MSFRDSRPKPSRRLPRLPKNRSHFRGVLRCLRSGNTRPRQRPGARSKAVEAWTNLPNYVNALASLNHRMNEVVNGAGARARATPHRAATVREWGLRDNRPAVGDERAPQEMSSEAS